MITFNIPEYLSTMTVILIDTLKTVIDPELHVNVVDLGLIYQVRVDDHLKEIEIKMTLSSRSCPMTESILSGVKNSIERVFPEYVANVNLVWEPEWNYRTIPAEGIKKLRGY